MRGLTIKLPKKVAQLILDDIATVDKALKVKKMPGDLADILHVVIKEAYCDIAYLQLENLDDSERDFDSYLSRADARKYCDMVDGFSFADDFLKQLRHSGIDMKGVDDNDDPGEIVSGLALDALSLLDNVGEFEYRVWEILKMLQFSPAMLTKGFYVSLTENCHRLILN